MQYAVVAAAVLAALAYAAWRAWRLVHTVQDDPCVGCSGCALKDAQNKNNGCEKKKQGEKFGRMRKKHYLCSCN